MVKPKKYLGQHFLKDKNIAQEIVSQLNDENINIVLEVGAGTGVLTEFLLQYDYDTYIIEIDNEAVDYLKQNYTELKDKIIHADFLTYDLANLFDSPFAVIGNFPYNISSQILFKTLEYRNKIPVLTGMFQREVAQRIASPPGNKSYGILSVFIQAFYHVKYLFTVPETVFHPQPKVKSGVLKLTRNKVNELACNEKLFFRIVKMAFNQRRKTLKNSLKAILPEKLKNEAILKKRPEQLAVDEFIILGRLFEQETKDK